ncbi:MAG: ribosome rescue protein RqcH [Zestosphaera sp.]
MTSDSGLVKKALSSLDVAVLAKELSDIVADSRIDNVFQAGSNSLLLKLVLRDGRHAFLMIEGGLRVCLTSHVTSGSASGRVTLFRRYLREGLVISVSQYMFERIMELGIRGREGDVKFIVELLPRGVMSVVDSTGNVLANTVDLKTKDRVIRPGVTYKYPPVFPDIRTVSGDEFISRISAGSELGRALVRVFGIPPEVVNEVIDESVRSRRPSSLSTGDLLTVHEALKSFIIGVIENPEPVILVCGERYVSFHPFKPRRVEGDCYIRTFATFNEAVDEFFVRAGGRPEVDEAVEERSRVEVSLREAREECEKLLESRRELSDVVVLIQENYDVLEDVWFCVSSKARGEGWGNVESCGVTGYDRNSGTYEVTLHGRTLKFTILKDFKTQYFDLLKRLKKVESKLEKTERSLGLLEERLREVDARVRERLGRTTLTRRFRWYHAYHWIITRGGFLSIGGRDADQNEKIVRRFLRGNDVFMHADVHGAPVFILFTNDVEPPESDLRDVAVLAASYSKAWKEALPSVDVFWVKGSQVSVAPPPGQFLPRGSFMVYGRKNYVRSVELRVSLGLRVVEDRYYELVVGPAELLRDTCVVAITLKPGSESPSKVATEFLELINKKSNYLVKDLMVDEVIKRIPGNSRIVETLVK